jgi:D-amino-acid dehydrogenase
VTVIEKDDICAGSSYGNVGWIANGHAIPLAAPGVLTQGLKWLLDPGSPLYIKPRLDPALWRWLWQFQAACTETRMMQGIPVLLALSRASSDLFRVLVTSEGLDCGYERKGLLHLFTRENAFQKAVKEAALLARFDVSSALLDQAGVRHLEPNVLPIVNRGIYYPNYAHLVPDRFVRELARVAEQRGARFRTGTEVLGLETAGRRVTTVVTTRGSFKADEIVLAAGAWSSILARDLHIRLPMQPAKGYSLTFRRPAGGPRMPLSLIEHKVAVTPMGDLLRFSSTLELAGFDTSINRRRLAATLQAVREMLPGVAGLELLEIWRGFRPTSPDGLPIIGRSPRFHNLILATGHGMLGITFGPVTGKLVAQIIANEPPVVNPFPLRVERF